MMELFEQINIRYFHPGLNIGLQDIKNAWLLSDKPAKLSTALHRGSLVYRLPKSGKRISYRTLKKGLIKKKLTIKMPFYLMPF
jgi:hypothetical protein